MNIFKKLLNNKFLPKLTFFAFFVSIIFTIIKIIRAPIVAPASEIALRVKSDYALLLAQSILGTLAMILPGFLQRKVKLKIPSAMLNVYAILLFCSIYLGEIRNIYYYIPYWGNILYILRGIALGAFAFSVIGFLNKSESITFFLKPGFVALFAFCFSLAICVLMELNRYLLDYIQQATIHKHTVFSREVHLLHAHSLPPIKILFFNSAGSIIMAAIGYKSLKYKKGWIEKLLIKTKHEAFIGILEQLDRASLETAHALSDALDARDEYTSGHSFRVMQYSELTAQKLNLSPDETEQLKISALLHDIGKLGLPDNILHKSSRPTDEEYEIIKTHPYIGAKILKNIEAFRDIVPAVYQHHERYDGKGYPDKIEGESITFHARIISIADTYDAMTTSRPYRGALSMEKALDEIERYKGVQFDPLLADTFIGVMKESVQS